MNYRTKSTLHTVQQTAWGLFLNCLSMILIIAILVVLFIAFVLQDMSNGVPPQPTNSARQSQIQRQMRYDPPQQYKEAN